MKELQEMCARLREWPRRVHAMPRELAQESLELCAELFKSETLFIAIDEGEEPWLLVGVLEAGNFTWREAEEAEFSPLVREDLEESSFYASPIDEGTMVVRRSPDEAPTPLSVPIHRRIRDEVKGEAVLSIPIRADSVSARLFIGAPKVDTEAMLILADTVGALLATRFEATNHTRAAVQDAVQQDRIRVGRDLHDGLLQSFTGVVLQLETIHSTLEVRPEEARRMITETQALIMADQRELRRFVEKLSPRPARREPVFDFTGRLEDLRSRFAKQWGVRVTLDVKKVDPFVSSFLGQETFRLIHEAVTNSAKHGHASTIHVGVTTEGSAIHIQVSDNGGGFPFQGKMTLEQMRESGTGPNVLAQRVSSLNGTLAVESTERGATVTMSVPLGWGGP